MAMKFPKTDPKSNNISRITQINYHFDNDLVAEEFIQVLASNSETNTSVYKWRVVPKRYAPALSFMFFHLELLKKAAVDCVENGGNAQHIKCARQHLVNLDSVLDILWADAMKDCDHGKMDATWHSTALEQWICVDYFVGTHYPEVVKTWTALDPQNEVALNSRFEDLGMSFHVISLINR
jgi:hypothetical protein